MVFDCIIMSRIRCPDNLMQAVSQQQMNDNEQHVDMYLEGVSFQFESVLLNVSS